MMTRCCCAGTVQTNVKGQVHPQLISVILRDMALKIPTGSPWHNMIMMRKCCPYTPILYNLIYYYIVF